MIWVRKQLSVVRWLTIVWGVWGLVWMSLEGDLGRVVVMGGSTTAVLLAHLSQRYVAERPFSLAGWLGITAVLGLLAGCGTVVLSLAAMALKTGLHAHGPEFSPAEINWLIAQLPLWGVSGGLLGLAAGLLRAANQRR